MKSIIFLMSVFLPMIPTLWIDSYNIKSPIWWTVFGAFWIGKLFGLIETFIDEEK